MSNDLAVVFEEELFKSQTEIAKHLSILEYYNQPSSSSELDLDIHNETEWDSMIPEDSPSLAGDLKPASLGGKRKFVDVEQSSSPVTKHKSKHRKSSHHHKHHDESQSHHTCHKESKSHHRKSSSYHHRFFSVKKSSKEHKVATSELKLYKKHRTNSVGSSSDYNEAPVFSKKSSNDNSHAESTVVKHELEKIGIGAAPFTRGQRVHLCKVIGRTSVEREKKLKFKNNFDPSVFDAEVDSEEENNNNPSLKLSDDKQLELLNELLLPLEECKTKVDDLSQNDDEEDEEELPDLEDVQIIGVSYNRNFTSAKPFLNLQDIKTEYPSLKFSTDVEDLFRRSPLLPAIKVPKLDIKSEFPDIICTKYFVPKIPRLKLRESKCLIKKEPFDSYWAENDSKDFWRLPLLECDDKALVTNSSRESPSYLKVLGSIKKEPLCTYENQPSREERHFMDAVATSETDQDHAPEDSKLKEYDEGYYDYDNFRFRNPGDYRHRKVRLREIQQQNAHSSSKTRVQKFRPNMVHTIESCYEEGEGFLDKVLTLTKDFTSSTHEPPIKVLQNILFDILLRCEKQIIVNKAYNLLQMLLDKHPPRDELAFDWHHIETVVGNICLPVGVMSRTEKKVDLQQNTLALQYMVMAIERELMDRTITQQRQMNKSIAAKWLSSESAFSNICAILRWIFQSISFGEYDELQKAFIKLNIDDNNSKEIEDIKEARDYIPKVFPIFNQLLDLSLVVSKQPTVCSQRIANELSFEYNQLTDLTHKRFILEHISNPLLRLKLVNRILSNCNTTDEAGQIQDFRNLNDIVNGPFKALPPCANAFTPPPSPAEMDIGARNQNCEEVVSSEAVEELVMLLWHCVNSYLLFAKHHLYEPLSRRALVKPSCKLEAEDKKALRSLPEHVCTLEKRLQKYGEFTTRTTMYFMCLHGVNCM